MKHIATFVAAILLAGCTALPEQVHEASNSELRQTSDFELCRAAMDPDWEYRRGGRELMLGELERRGFNKDSCFDVLLSEHGSSTMCSRYQRAVARGEPTALVGFATTLSRQELELGFARHNLSCSAAGYNPESGLGAIGRQVDKFNDNMSDMYQNNKTVDCYEVYEGKIRCRQY
ncbi:hypothetical protein [Halomonas sp. LBP4]|uniref:hypothetical protein n=1 Tax=Halomonas sp. LBP4 TaxID=2044917 RepID=UPI000D759ACF|nr:hypothetical protein [Halomonas sp. LBP4]PXX97352.1 hypothetical protein CR157_11505 [Halomonas sp. LBP4]